MSTQTLHKHHNDSKNSSLLFVALAIPIIVFVLVFTILFMRNRNLQLSRQAVKNTYVNPTQTQQRVSDEDPYSGEVIEYDGIEIEVPPPTL